MNNKKNSKIKYTKELFDKVKNGDNDSIALLYESTKEIGYPRAYSMLKNHYDAEDIVSDSFLKVLNKIHTLKSPSDFPRWVKTIVDNTARDFIKKHKASLYDDLSVLNFNENDDNAKIVNPVTSAESNENVELFKKLVGALKQEQSIALIMQMEGFKIKEIAEHMDCKEATVKKRIKTAKTILGKKAEELKKQGYTLNGMTAMDFFTFMSKQLGVTSYNVSSILGFSTVNSLMYRVIASVIAVAFITFGGLIGCNLLYGNPILDNTYEPQITYKIANQNVKVTQTQSNTIPVVEPTYTPIVQPSSAPFSEPYSNTITNTLPSTVYVPTLSVIPVTVPVGSSRSSRNSGNVATSNSYLIPTSSNKSTNNERNFGNLTLYDISYLKTLLACSISYNSNNYINLSDLGIETILNSYDKIEKEFYDVSDLLSSKTIFESSSKQFVRVQQNDLQDFALNAFGKDISVSNSFNDKYLKDGYYTINSYNETVSAKTLSLKKIEYTNDRNQFTLTYKLENSNYYDTEFNDKCEFVSIFKRNKGNSKYPYTLISNLPIYSNSVLSGAYKKSTNHKTVDYGDFTFDIPNKYAYENDGDNVIIYTSLTAKNEKDTSNISLIIKRYRSWNDDNMSTKISNFIAMKNNTYYYFEYGKAFSEYDIRLSSFKFK